MFVYYKNFGRTSSIGFSIKVYDTVDVRNNNATYNKNLFKILKSKSIKIYKNIICVKYTA